MMMIACLLFVFLVATVPVRYRYYYSSTQDRDKLIYLTVNPEVAPVSMYVPRWRLGVQE